MAANTDKFKKGARRFTTTVGAGGISDATVTTVPLTSVTGLPTDTAIEITVDRVDASGNLTLSNEEVITGVVSGSNLITCTRGTEGTAQSHSAGAVVEVRLTADQWDDVIDGILEEHNQDGTHDTSNMNGYDLLTGWQSYTAVTPTFTSSTDGVDTISFAGVDLTDDYQKGDWVKISSGGGSNKIYKVKSVAFSTNTTMTVVGETSVSGTITSISFSKQQSPQGATPWTDLLAARAVRTSEQVISDNVATVLNYSSEEYDSNGDLDYSTGVYTAPVTGRYSINGVLFIYDGSYKIVQSYLAINIDGTGYQVDRSYPTVGSGAGVYKTHTLSIEKMLNRGAVVKLNGYIDTSDGTAVATGISTTNKNSFDVNFKGI